MYDRHSIIPVALFVREVHAIDKPSKLRIDFLKGLGRAPLAFFEGGIRCICEEQLPSSIQRAVLGRLSSITPVALETPETQLQLDSVETNHGCSLVVATTTYSKSIFSGVLAIIPINLTGFQPATWSATPIPLPRP